MLKKELLAKQICISRTYYFHVKECIDQSCLFHIHTPINSDDEIERFPDPIPYTDENGIERYKEGQDDEEMFMTSKLADMTKRRHGAPFPPDKQHAKNVLKNVKCKSVRRVVWFTQSDDQYRLKKRAIYMYVGEVLLTSTKIPWHMSGKYIVFCPHRNTILWTGFPRHMCLLWEKKNFILSANCTGVRIKPKKWRLMKIG